MKRTLLLLTICVLLAGSKLVTMGLDASPGIIATLKADLTVQDVSCPCTFTFSGTIQVPQAGTVQYQFVRSDGGTSSLTVLNCPQAGTYPVKTSWTLTQTYNGWIVLKIVSPEAVESNKANFYLTCHPKVEINPDFLNTKLVYGPPNTPVLQISGWNFGSSQGTRNVSLDGTPVLPRPGWSLVSWTDMTIQIKVRICDLIIWDHIYQMAITEGGQIVSNTIPFRPLYIPATPGNQINYYPGSTLSFAVYNLPVSSAGYSVRFYAGNVIPLQSWTGAAGCVPGQIRVGLPMGIMARQYVIGLYKGNQIVSDDSFGITVVPLPLIKK